MCKDKNSKKNFESNRVSIFTGNLHFTRALSGCKMNLKPYFLPAFSSFSLRPCLLQKGSKYKRRLHFIWRWKIPLKTAGCYECVCICMYVIKEKGILFLLSPATFLLFSSKSRKTSSPYIFRELFFLSFVSCSTNTEYSITKAVTLRSFALWSFLLPGWLSVFPACDGCIYRPMDERGFL